ncbi:hypothetical protein [Hymenobacter terrenus]|uniref:hypothetical protein n=1 Tax=Hymenobacter terrenus TaxID=1629124 RepID=UPI000698ABAB|nr:hypothetical protein [Hymenobacter terrenus]
MFYSISKQVASVLEKSRIVKTRLVNIKKELTKPDSFYKGENFENYVEDVLFPPDRYTLIRRTDTYERNRKRYSEASQDPDLLFRCKQTQNKFAVEAKYRTSLINGQLRWAKGYQLDRYKKFEKENDVPVFIAVGLQGLSTRPDAVFLFPVRKINYFHLNFDIALQYKLSTSSVESTHLWKLIGYNNRR